MTQVGERARGRWTLRKGPEEVQAHRVCAEEEHAFTYIPNDWSPGRDCLGVSGRQVGGLLPESGVRVRNGPWAPVATKEEVGRGWR